MIRWEAVRVAYNGSFVVGPIDLQVASGEWAAIIGPNGAGKSTLLKAGAAGLEHEGRVTIGGGAGKRGLDVAWMPQRPMLPDEMTVSSYALLGRTPHLGYLQSEGKADFEATENALRRLDLAGLAGRKLSTLSGGEAQRVVLARALAQESPVLLLDEPTSSLDLGHAVEVLELIDALRRDRGLTVVTAIHDLTLAERFADRLVLMAGGRVIDEGTGRQVLSASNLASHYGPGLDVIDHHGRPTVVPIRMNNPDD
jgi:iron complex transport system ATP-binding protein